MTEQTKSGGRGRIQISQVQMNLILVAVEHGFRMCERGQNLEAALTSVYDLYEVERPS